MRCDNGTEIGRNSEEFDNLRTFNRFEVGSRNFFWIRILTFLKLFNPVSLWRAYVRFSELR